jgi:tetratricopeptide (TPR) repeat protein
LTIFRTVIAVFLMGSPEFIPLPNRDASRIIRGFLYQIELTIKRWIELDDASILELERGEDIDTVQRAFSAREMRLLEQVKMRSSSISLRSAEALEALVNFFSSFKANPNLELRFRYLTNAETAVERNMDFGGRRPALRVWNEFSSGHLSEREADTFLKNLREFLQKVNRPDKVRPPDWNQFQAIFGAKSAEFAAFVKRVEWSFGNPEVGGLASEIEAALVQSGNVNLQDVRTAHHELLTFVITKLSSPGPKRLTREELRTELRDLRKSSVNPVLLGMVEAQLRQLSERDQLARDLRFSLDDMGQSAGPAMSLHIDPALPAALSTIPVPIIGGAQRSENVVKLVEALAHSTWVALHGDSGSGKTQLVRLLTERISTPIWISFRNIPAEQMGTTFDSYLASKSRAPRTGNLREWYEAACSRLASGTTFFVDDIPCDGKAGLLSKLCIFVECAVRKGVKIVSTAADKVLPSPREHLGSAFLEMPIPRFSDEEIKEYFHNHAAPEALFSNSHFMGLVDSLTRRHPQILTALTRYMEDNGWKYDTNTVSRLIRRDFADDLKIQTRRVLSATVPEGTRELLYRLNVVGPLFTDQDAVRVGTVPPPISLPTDKLSECVGLWIQRLTSDMSIMSPLVEQLGPANITVETQKRIHLEKAQSILETKNLNQFDALAAIKHFESAGRLEDAVGVLCVALNELNEVSAQDVDDCGLLEIWTHVDLPAAIPIRKQLLLTALQIRARKRHKVPFSVLLRRFDALFEKAKASNPLAAFGSCCMLSIAMSDADGARALKYAIAAISLQDAVKNLLPADLVAKAAELIWFGTPHLQIPKDLITLLQDAARMSDSQISRIFKSEMAAQSCRFICDRLWLREAGKPNPQWAVLEAELADIADKASDLRAMTLLAAVTRARIVIAADYKKDLEKALALANEVADVVRDDNRANFLVAFTIGVSCCDREEWNAALGWLNRAIELREHLYGDLYARALLSRALAVQKTGASARPDCLRAVEFARGSDSVSELMLVRSLGEYSISLWQDGDEEAFFEAWQETIDRILAARDDTNDWKEVFVLTGNNTGWFGSNQRGLAPVPNMTQPFQGMYLRYSPQIVGLYAQETLWYMPASMVYLAERMGKYVESSSWALRATVIAAGSPIGGDAGTLLLYAIPQSIRDRRYSEALGFVLQAVEARLAPTDAITAFAKSRENEEFRNIVEQRPVVTVSPTTEFLALTITPLLIDLLTWHMVNQGDAELAGASVIATCQDLAEKSDTPETWRLMATALEQIFAPTAVLDGILEAARQHSQQGRYLPALISFLGTARLGAPAAVCTHWLPALEFYERKFSKSRLHIQLAAECVNKFWRAMAAAMPFAFRQPRTLQEKLEELAPRQDLLPRHTMRVVVWHLGIGVAAEAKQWLES